MKLYYAPGTCALACWISLEWANVEYSVERVNPKSEAYQQINPLGLVPALDIQSSRPMTQASAILQYIAQVADNQVLGADSGLENQFEFNEIMAFLTGDFHPAFWPYFSPQRYTTSTDQTALESVRQSAFERVDRVMMHLNDLIGESDHVYRNKRTVIDAYAFVMVLWTDSFQKSYRSYENIDRFMRKMKEDETVDMVVRASKKA